MQAKYFKENINLIQVLIKNLKKTLKPQFYICIWTFQHSYYYIQLRVLLDGAKGEIRNDARQYIGIKDFMNLTNIFFKSMIFEIVLFKSLRNSKRRNKIYYITYTFDLQN